MPKFPIRDQKIVRSKIKDYLSALERDDDFINSFEQGYCAGISSLWLYSKWLQTQPNPENKPRDDYDWFEYTRDMIASWDGNLDSLTTEDPQDPDYPDKKKKNFDRFINHIRLLQYPHEYLPLEQGDLSELLEDTVGRAKDDTRKIRTIDKKSIGALFTLEQLKQLLKEENFIQKDTMIFIASDSHAVSLFRIGDNYYYLDSNNPLGEIRSASTDKIAELIFKSNNFSERKPSPLLFNISSFHKMADIPVHDILTRIKPALSHENRFRSSRGVFTNLGVAIRSQSLESVNYFLEKKEEGVDIDARMEGGKTALMMAIMCGNKEIVERLLAAKANTDLKNEKGMTALMMAIDKGDSEIAKILLEAGANTNLENKEDLSTLMIAAKLGHLEIVKILLENGANINLQDKNNALMIAAILGHLEVVKTLLENGASIDLQDKKGNMVFELAIKNGHLKIVEFFTKKTGHELFAWALELGHFNIARKILSKDEHGISPHNINILLKKDIESDAVDAVYEIAKNLNIDLLDWGTQNEFSYSDFLRWGITNNSPKIIEDILAKENHGLSTENIDEALRSAADLGSIKAAKAITEKNDFELFMLAIREGYPNLITSTNELSLSDIMEGLRLAVEQENTDIAYAIIRNHFDRLFCLSAKEGRLDYIKELIALKRNHPELYIHNLKNVVYEGFDMTALRYAATSGHSGIVDELLEITEFDERSNTNDRETLRIAAKNGHSKVVEALIGYSYDDDLDFLTKTISLSIESRRSNLLSELEQDLISFSDYNQEPIPTSVLYTICGKALDKGFIGFAKTTSTIAKKDDPDFPNFLLKTSVENNLSDAFRILLEDDEFKINDEKLHEYLLYATRHGFVDIVNEALLYAEKNPDLDFDITRIDPDSGKSILMIAEEEGHPDIVNLISKKISLREEPETATTDSTAKIMRHLGTRNKAVTAIEETPDVIDSLETPEPEREKPIEPEEQDATESKSFQM